MTTISTSSGPDLAPSDETFPARSRAVAVRRAFLIACPVLAGLFAVLGATADPGAGTSGPAMFRIYTEHPDPLQLKSLGFHWSYAFWDHMSDTMWGVAALTVPGMLGFMLALPLATIALWRAGLVRWWAFAAVLGGYAAFMLSNVMWWGCVLTTACFAVLAFAVARATRPSR